MIQVSDMRSCALTKETTDHDGEAVEKGGRPKVAKRLVTMKGDLFENRFYIS